MPTIVALMIEAILLVNLIFLMSKLRKKQLSEELNITVSAIALVGILMIVTVILRILSSF